MSQAGDKLLDLLEQALVERIKYILLETANKKISNKDAETILVKIGMRILPKKL